MTQLALFADERPATAPHSPPPAPPLRTPRPARAAPVRPSHVVRTPFDGTDRTFCGRRITDVPIVGSQFVAAHIAGHGLIVCAECAANLESELPS